MGAQKQSYSIADYAEMQEKLEAFLKKSDQEIIPDYLAYRELILKIYSTLPKVNFSLCLYPEREVGNFLNATLYDLQGKSYFAKKRTKDPPWTKKKVESWIKQTATITFLKIHGYGHVSISYKYPANETEYVSHEYTFENDPMHRTMWRWDSSEVEATFKVGSTRDCWVSDQNIYRHHIGLIS